MLSQYVHQKNIKDLSKALTNTSKTSRQTKIKVLIYQDYPDERNKEKEFDLIKEIARKKAMYCKLKFSTIQWKNNRNKVYIDIEDQTKKVFQKELIKKFGKKYSSKFIKGQNYIYEFLPENGKTKKAITDLLVSDSIITLLIFNNYNEHISSFVFKNLISLVIDVCTKSGMKRKNEISIQYDKAFPIEITCDMKLLEIFLFIFLKYFIFHSSENTINVSYSLIDTTTEDYVTCIKISSTKLEQTAINFLDNIIAYPFGFFQILKEFIEEKDFNIIIGKKIITSYFKGSLSFNKFNNPYTLNIEVHFLRTIDYNNLIKISSKICSISENRKSFLLGEVPNNKKSNGCMDKLNQCEDINNLQVNPNKTTVNKTQGYNTINVGEANKDYRISAMKKLINEELKLSQSRQKNDLILFSIY